MNARESSSRGGSRDRRSSRTDHDRSRNHRDAKGRERSGSRGRGGPRAGYSQNRPSERARTATVSRLAAYETLRAVSDDDAYANLTLPHMLRKHRVHGRDAAFATELTYGTLRAQGRLDAILGQCVDRPLNTVEPSVLNVLRLGAYQILDMAVADHAANSETVGLARQVAGAGAAGFVNAVLRRVTEKTTEQWLAEILDGEAEDSIAALALRHAHPEWVVRALGDALAVHGRDRSELPALLAAHNEAPSVSLAMRPGLSDLEELKAAGATDALWSIMGASWPGGDPGSIPAVSENRAGIQDEGSQLVVLALATGSDDLVLADDAEWLDLCAGPGGKTAILGGFTVDHDAALLATEIQPHRSELVERSVRALVDAGCDITVKTADGTTIGEQHPARFSRILADVPCSGLGALRRRPESRWRRTPADIGQLGKLQRDLLSSALRAAAPGGVVAYVTCSPHMAETSLIIKDVLRRNPSVQQLDARPAVRAAVLPDKHGDIDLGEGPHVQLWPHVHGTDAMFLALLRTPTDT